VHGGGGADVMDRDPASLANLARYCARHGVTSFLPTTWSASREATEAALARIAAAIGPIDNGARILGAHLEGPYLNAEHCGAQNVSVIRRADRDEALAFLDTGVLRIVSLAPEFAENVWLIDECVRRGIAVAAAHTAATYDQFVAATQRGLKRSTHTFNAMRGLHHREPGTLGAVLTLPGIDCELIADGVHVHPAAMRLLLAAKGVDRIILITDAIRAAGMPDGEYALDTRTISVRNGSAHLPDGTLAGSVLDMDTALRRFLDATSLSLADAWQVSSRNAARSIGIVDRTGRIATGLDADLVALRDDLTVNMTVAQGRIIYRRPA
jgi:N-acetylglucosamine-6-phosphate deacetylase